MKDFYAVYKEQNTELTCLREEYFKVLKMIKEENWKDHLILGNNLKAVDNSTLQ